MATEQKQEQSTEDKKVVKKDPTSEIVSVLTELQSTDSNFKNAVALTQNQYKSYLKTMVTVVKQEKILEAQANEIKAKVEPELITSLQGIVPKLVSLLGDNGSFNKLVNYIAVILRYQPKAADESDEEIIKGTSHSAIRRLMKLYQETYGYIYKTPEIKSPAESETQKIQRNQYAVVITEQNELVKLLNELTEARRTANLKELAIILEEPHNYIGFEVRLREPPN